MIFKPLEKEALSEIIHLEINKLGSRLQDHQMALNIPDSVISFLVAKGHSPEMGARPLRRVVEQYLEDPLAEMLLKESCRQEARKLRARLLEERVIFEREEESPALAVEGDGPATVTADES